MTHLGESLTALLDGALPPAERERALAHLAGCAECRAAEARLRAALAALSSLPAPPEPSPAFAQRFYARLAREKAEPRGWLAGIRWRWVLPAAAACAAAALGLGVDLRHRREQERAALHLELFESYEAVEAAADLPPEDVELVAHLHELGGKR